MVKFFGSFVLIVETLAFVISDAIKLAAGDEIEILRPLVCAVVRDVESSESIVIADIFGVVLIMAVIEVFVVDVVFGFDSVDNVSVNQSSIDAVVNFNASVGGLVAEVVVFKTTVARVVVFAFFNSVDVDEMIVS